MPPPRRSRRASPWLLTPLVAVSLAACSEPKPEPEIASSSGEVSYAESYPATVAATIGAFGDAQKSASDIDGRLSTYPDAFDEKVDWTVVADTLAQADGVGHSRAYLDGLEDVRAARTFFEEEQDELSKKVGGAAHHAAKQGGCEGDDVAGAAVHAMKKTVAERLEERLRKANDAQRLVHRHEETLGKKNAAALRQQADEVALAAHLVHIEMVLQKVRLVRVIEEADAVEKTADALIEQERQYRAESGRSDAQKKASEERAAAMHKAKAQMEASVASAKKTAGEMEQRIAEAQKRHQEAMAALLATVRGRVEKR